MRAINFVFSALLLAQWVAVVFGGWVPRFETVASWTFLVGGLFYMHLALRQDQ
jgi:hypothetical protein